MSSVFRGWQGCALVALGLAGPRLGGTITIDSFSGYQIGWDGNEGESFDSAVAANWALASAGATAIASSQLWPWVGGPSEPENAYHLTANLNDGSYGNYHSWIGGEPEEGVTPFAGVLLAQPVAVTSFAFGRDNAASALNDRTDGLYTLQFTLDGINWTSIGTIELAGDDEDLVPGGGYTSYLRHAFTLSTSGEEPIVATGLRLLVPSTGVGAGVAIDELEVYGAAIPEPAALPLLLAAVAGCALLRRPGRSR